MSSINPARRAAARLSPLGLTLLAITSIEWGLNLPIMKNLLAEWPPPRAAMLREIAALVFTLGGVAVALRAWPAHKEKGRRLENAPPFELTTSRYCAGQG